MVATCARTQFVLVARVTQRRCLTIQARRIQTRPTARAENTALLADVERSLLPDRCNWWSVPSHGAWRLEIVLHDTKRSVLASAFTSTKAHPAQSVCLHEPRRIFPLRPFRVFRNPSCLVLFTRPWTESTHLLLFSLLVRSFLALASSSAATSFRPRHEPVRSTWRFVVTKPKPIPFETDEASLSKGPRSPFRKEIRPGLD